MASTTSAVAKKPSTKVDHAAGTEHSIGIAGLKVIRSPDSVRTVLGSCIGIAIYDPIAGIGALGHVILPDSSSGTGDPMKFADTATEMLIEELLVAGARRSRLAAKISGGAAMFGTASGGNLGDRNAVAVRAKLSECGVPLKGEAVGGTKGRKMFLAPINGEVRVEIIGETSQMI
jgi:chemotaxis protein CheD